jgi:hypothetical protein
MARKARNMQYRKLEILQYGFRRHLTVRTTSVASRFAVFETESHISLPLRGLLPLRRPDRYCCALIIPLRKEATTHMKDDTSQDRVIALLTQLQDLTVKIGILVKDHQALGLLLSDVASITRNLSALLQQGKVRMPFVHAIIPLLVGIVKDIVGKWLNRYLLSAVNGISLITFITCATSVST